MIIKGLGAPAFCLAALTILSIQFSPTTDAQDWRPEVSPYGEQNLQIRRDKFDILLPEIMREGI